MDVIRNQIDKLIMCSDVDQLMAPEGNAREVYHSCFDEIIKTDDFIFDSRTKRPSE
ncbi:MAG: CRISPR-associated endonuclease Cas1 [Pseudothermotoga sp.]